MDYVARATAYAVNVVIGAIPACFEARAACQRYLSPHSEYYLDHDAAHHACHFLEQLPHVKGRWSKNHELLVLSDWQIFSTVNLFGFKHCVAGLRKYRRAYIKMPRKNGKSTWAAGIGLYMLCADNEDGGEIYCGAVTEKQAWEVFGPARKMALKDKELQEYFSITINAKNLSITETFSKFEPVIGSPGDGASPSCAIVDEYHEHKSPDQYDTFDTGMGSREQPLMLVITTAGDNIGGPCYDLEDEARQVVFGTVQDETLFSLIYGVDPHDEWDDPLSLIKANPNYNISVSAEYLLAKLNTAKQRSAKRGIFKTKHLNMWVGARDAYFEADKWRSLGNPDLNMDDFKHRECRLAIDLATKVDPAALIIGFLPVIEKNEKGKDEIVEPWAVFSKFYIPEAKADDEANKDYRAWVDAGHMVATPGTVIDFDFIGEDVIELNKNFDVLDVSFDPFQATMFSTTMMKVGISMVEYGATVRNFSEPMKDLDGTIREGDIIHDGNPVMNWMVGNVTAREDAKNNVFPRKNLIIQKIDGPVALIMIFGRCIADIEQDETSVYETHGVIQQ